MSENKWQEIDYRNLSSRARTRYHKAFLRHDSKRYSNFYLNNSVSNFLISTVVENYLHGEIVRPISGQSFATYALDISGSMRGVPIAIAALACIEGGSKFWLPFSKDGNSEIIKMEMNLQDPIKEITSYKNYRSNLSGDFPDKFFHLIIISNVSVDLEDLQKYKHLCEHLTYWCLHIKSPIITNLDNLTLIEGYDLCLYREISNGDIVTPESHMDNVIKLNRSFFTSF